MEPCSTEAKAGHLHLRVLVLEWLVESLSPFNVDSSGGASSGCMTGEAGGEDKGELSASE